MSTDYQRRTLRLGLCAGEEQAEMQHLYRTNAEFHAGIDTLAAVLPIFVASLAQHSREQAAKMEQLVETMNRQVNVFCAGCVDRNHPHADGCPRP